MPLGFFRKFFDGGRGSNARPDAAPQPAPEPLSETTEPLREPSPDIHESNGSPEFRFWGRQHERLNVPKEGLPSISDDQASSLHRYLIRYETALGIREALQEGIPAPVAKADRDLVIKLVALDEKTPYSTVAHNFQVRSCSDDDEDCSKAPSWDQDIALAFIQWVSRLDPFVIATFIYMHSCDQVACELMEFESAEKERFINDLYHWALDFDVYSGD